MNDLPAVHADRNGWLPDALARLEKHGVVVVNDVLSTGQIDALRVGSYRAQAAIVDEIGSRRLDQAGEVGVLRIPMKYDRAFLQLFEVPEMLAVVDATVGTTAICHLQNGFILPPNTGDDSSVFQHRWHRDFPRYLNGYVASVNTFFCLSEFTEATGATTFAAGSHQRPDDALPDASEWSPCVADAEPGAMVVFDSTTWHRAGENRSEGDRLAVNHQWTRPWVKQQIDYVRALGKEMLGTLPERTQQLLGWYTRVPTSLDEYYRPAGERLYRAGQG